MDTDAQIQEMREYLRKHGYNSLRLSRSVKAANKIAHSHVKFLKHNGDRGKWFE